jgi:ubiquinone/menaquinone biosynthesis C-methylase UbiE
MKPLYLAPSVRAGLGACLRPGGATLTRRIVDLIAPDTAGIALDAGCGLGASMTFLRQVGFRTVIGLDLEDELLREARKKHQCLARADLAHLPLPDSCLAMILCECVWNLTERRQVLREFARSLRPGGFLALTDIYARRGNNNNPPGTWPVRCCFSQATDLETVAGLVTAAGFEILILEDHTRLLTRTAAEFVFAHGSLQGFWQAVTGDTNQANAACAATAAIRPGLFLLIARSNS